MRFLIVYSAVACSTAAKRWSDIIRDSIESCTEVSDISNDYTEVTNMKHLDKYLIDINRAVKTEDTKAFDLIDVVYIIGDHRRMPWSESNNRVTYYY